jgi:hypothetical protein
MSTNAAAGAAVAGGTVCTGSGATAAGAGDDRRIHNATPAAHAAARTTRSQTAERFISGADR